MMFLFSVNLSQIVLISNTNIYCEMSLSGLNCEVSNLCFFLHISSENYFYDTEQCLITIFPYAAVHQLGPSIFLGG